MQITIKQTQRCSTSVVIREIQLKISVRNHFTCSRRAKAKTQKNANADEDMEHLELSDTYTADRRVKWFNHSGQLFGSFSESKSNSTPSYYLRQMKHVCKIYIRMFKAVFLIVDKNLETIQTSTTGRMDKQTVIFIKVNTTQQ